MMIDDFSYFFLLLLLLLLLPVQKIAPGREHTMAVKDGEASKLHPKTP